MRLFDKIPNFESDNIENLLRLATVNFYMDDIKQCEKNIADIINIIQSKVNVDIGCF